jgi:O-antigen/teichoic acid export membrane protein
VSAEPTASTDDIRRGARITGSGFVLRLAARLPFLYVAARLYGADALGQFAYAILILELAAHLATLGLKRYLLSALATSDTLNRTATAAIIAGLGGSVIAAVVLAVFPRLLVPVDLAIPAPIRGVLFLIPLIVVLDLMLSALLHVQELKAQVWSRSIVEPWVLLIVATAVAVYAGDAHPLLKSHGLLMGYAASLIAAFLVALIFYRRHFSVVIPNFSEIRTLVHASLPLFASDAIDWAQRRVDVLLLGQIAGAKAVGVYYLCQQVATLVQKLRASFEPILLATTARALEQNAQAELQTNISHVQRWLFTVQVFVLAIFGVMGGWMLTAFTGISAPGLTLTLALLLLAELWAGAFGIVEVPLIYAVPRKNLVIGFVVLLVEILIALVAIPGMALPGAGPVGAALALCVAFALGALLRSVLAWQHLSHLPPFRAMALVASAAGSLAVLLWLLKHAFLS